MMHDDALLDSVAVLALGALPEAEATAVAAHVRACPECTALYAELRGVADLVGLEADAPIADEIAAARLKARIMAEVRPAARDAGRVSSAPPAPRRSMAAYAGYALAAAAAIVAIVFGAQNATLRSGRDADTARIAALQSRATALEGQQVDLRFRLAAVLRRETQFAALFAAPGSRSFAVPSGQVITSKGHVILALELPQLPKGRVYQAWTLAKGAKSAAEVQPSSTFRPGPSGIAIVELPEDAGGLAAVALSVEPAGGSLKPTTTPKFVRPLG